MGASIEKPKTIKGIWSQSAVMLIILMMQMPTFHHETNKVYSIAELNTLVVNQIYEVSKPYYIQTYQRKTSAYKTTKRLYDELSRRRFSAIRKAFVCLYKIIMDSY